VSARGFGRSVGKAEELDHAVIERSAPSMPSKPIMPSSIGVSMKPGQMAFARMPLR
jgi:hypothetical protein